MRNADQSTIGRYDDNICGCTILFLYFLEHCPDTLCLKYYKLFQTYMSENSGQNHVRP